MTHWRGSPCQEPASGSRSASSTWSCWSSSPFSVSARVTGCSVSSASSSPSCGSSGRSCPAGTHAADTGHAASRPAFHRPEYGPIPGREVPAMSEPAVSEPAARRGRRRAAWTARVRRYREKLRAYTERLERRPRVAFWLQVNRRFNKIEGKHLALVISLNLFVAVIPLLIIIYAFIASFSANRSFGVLIDKDLHLTGSSALVKVSRTTSALLPVR